LAESPPATAAEADALVDADGRVAPGQAGAVIPPWALTAPVEELVPALEALCYALNRPLTLAEAGAVLGRPARELAPALDALAASLRGRGLMLQRHGDELQLVTRPEVAWAVQRALHPERPARLSRPSMETLAIVAYRQPVTRAGIEAIRGVNCEAVLENLERRGLIGEVGRQDTPGHPRLFGTTMRFLQTVGLERIDDLPPLPEGVSIPQLDGEFEGELEGDEGELEGHEGDDDRRDEGDDDGGEPEAAEGDDDGGQPEAAGGGIEAAGGDVEGTLPGPLEGARGEGEGKEGSSRAGQGP